jgi:hypothetical protein
MGVAQTEVVMNPSQFHLILVGTAAIAFCGCSPEPQKARYTVDEYVANPDAMELKLQECANNPGDSRNDPDCVNVKAAAERKGIGSLRDLPPMGLSPQTDDRESPTDDQRRD